MRQNVFYPWTISQNGIYFLPQNLDTVPTAMDWRDILRPFALGRPLWWAILIAVVLFGSVQLAIRAYLQPQEQPQRPTGAVLCSFDPAVENEETRRREGTLPSPSSALWYATARIIGRSQFSLHFTETLDTNVFTWDYAGRVVNRSGQVWRKPILHIRYIDRSGENTPWITSNERVPLTPEIIDPGNSGEFKLTVWKPDKKNDWVCIKPSVVFYPPFPSKTPMSASPAAPGSPPAS